MSSVINRIKAFAVRRPLLSVWIVFFIYTLFLGIFVQTILLPVFYPQLDMGNGLFKGGDWSKLHGFALDLVQQIQTYGWQAWQVRPNEQGPSGIAALFYTAFGPYPLVLLPQNALLHSAGAVALIQVIRPFAPRLRYAVYAVLPFVLMPSNILWTTQISKETYFVPGNIFLLLSLLILSQKETWNGRPRAIAISILLTLSAVLLFYVGRPYHIKMSQVVFGFIAAGISLKFIASFFRNQMQLPQMLIAIAVMTGLLFSFSALDDHAQSFIHSEEVNTTGDLQVDFYKRNPGIAAPPLVRWEPSPFLPRTADRQLERLSIARFKLSRLFPYPHQSVDAHIQFNGFGDMVKYSPSAMATSLFFPYPNTWFNFWSFENTWPMMTIPPWIFPFEAEMVLVYLGLALLPLLIVAQRRSPQLWTILFYSVSMLLLFALSHPHISSLYRKRYPFLMTLVALGICGWFLFRNREIQLVQKTKKKPPS